MVTEEAYLKVLERAEKAESHFLDAQELIQKLMIKRDEAVAHAKLMRDALLKVDTHDRDCDWERGGRTCDCWTFKSIANDALEVTPPEALLRLEKQEADLRFEMENIKKSRDYHATQVSNMAVAYGMRVAECDQAVAHADIMRDALEEIRKEAKKTKELWLLEIVVQALSQVPSQASLGKRESEAMIQQLKQLIKKANDVVGSLRLQPYDDNASDVEFIYLTLDEALSLKPPKALERHQLLHRELDQLKEQKKLLRGLVERIQDYSEKPDGCLICGNDGGHHKECPLEPAFYILDKTK